MKIHIVAMRAAVIGLAVVVALGAGNLLTAQRQREQASESTAAQAAQSAASANIYAMSFDPKSPTQTALIVIDSATGATRTLATLQHAAGWGPDGFVSPEGTRIAILTPHPDAAKGGALSTLATIAVAGGAPVTIDADTDLRPEAPPAWSADGTQIFYFRRRNAASEIVVAPSGGGSARVAYSGTRQIEFIGMTPAGLVVLGNDASPGRYAALLKSDGTLKDLPFRLSGDFSPPPQFASGVLAYSATPVQGGPQAALISTATGAADPRLVLSGLSFAVASDASRIVMDDRAAFGHGVSQVKVWDRASRTTRDVRTTAGRLAHPVESRSWAPDASWLALESDEFDAKGTLRARGIEALRPDGTGLRLFVPPVSGSLRLVGVV